MATSLLPCWNFVWFGLVQILCILSQFLGVHIFLSVACLVHTVVLVCIFLGVTTGIVLSFSMLFLKKTISLILSFSMCGVEVLSSPSPCWEAYSFSHCSAHIWALILVRTYGSSFWHSMIQNLIANLLIL